MFGKINFGQPRRRTGEAKRRLKRLDWIEKRIENLENEKSKLDEENSYLSKTDKLYIINEKKLNELEGTLTILYHEHDQLEEVY